MIFNIPKIEYFRLPVAMLQPKGKNRQTRRRTIFGKGGKQIRNWDGGK